MKERLWDTWIVLYIQSNVIVTEEGRAEICTLPVLCEQSRCRSEEYLRSQNSTFAAYAMHIYFRFYM